MTDTLDSVLAELTALRTKVADLEARVAATDRTRPSRDDAPDPVDGPITRRAALRTAGVVAAGALAGGAALLQSAAPAAAYTSSGTFHGTASGAEPGLRAESSITTNAIYASSSADATHAVYATASGGNYAYGIWGLAQTGGTNSGVRGTATSGFGVFGDATTGSGVRGTSSSGGKGGDFTSVGGGTGVQTVTDSGLALYAQSTSGSAVNARSSAGYAIEASSDASTAAVIQGVNGIAAYGVASGGLGGTAIECHGNRASIYIVPQGAAPTTRSDYYNVGELHADSTGALWYCVTAGAGTSAKWRKLAAATSAGTFHAIAPSRVYDSRAASPSQGVIANNAYRTVSVADKRDNSGNVTSTNVVPAGATAVAANVTVTGTTGTNNFCINPGGYTTHPASTINWFATGQQLANGVVLTLDSNRQVTIVAGAQGGSAHVIIDITGYWL